MGGLPQGSVFTRHLLILDVSRASIRILHGTVKTYERKSENTSKLRVQRSLGGRKRWVFSILMMGIPFLFFLILEAGLRLVGYGQSYPLFISFEEGPAYRYQNPDVARRYFAAQRRVPNSNIDFFRATKEPNGFRLFVQGGSSAAGYPFYHGGMFSRMLEQRLQQTFPDRDIEVINTAMAAVNSYTMVDLVDEIIAEQPDAILIYAGHNEYYGALGVASAESFGRVQSLVRVYLKLRDFRTVQALRNGLSWIRRGLQGEVVVDEESTLMERIVGEQTIPIGSTLYKQGLEQFRKNLETLLARYKEINIPVFVGTLASNERDHRPFISRLSEQTDEELWANLNQQARATMARGDTAATLGLFDAMIKLDASVADAHYTRGRLLEALGRYTEARSAFIRAKDLDQLRFRAPEELNEIIRDVAKDYGAIVVETQRALIEASRGNIIGNELMVEHLHPNLDGYFVIADAFYRALKIYGLIEPKWTHPVSKERARTERLHTEVDSLVGMYRIRKLMGGWPFQPVGTVDRYLDTLKAQTIPEQVALDLYRNKVSWRMATNNLRAYYEQKGEYHRALQAALAMVQEYPLDPVAYIAGGDVLIKQGRYEEALVYYYAANDLTESPQANRMIGAILLRQKDQIGAISYLEKALTEKPDDMVSLYNLAGAYTLEQQYERARETVNTLLRLDPDHADAQRLLASLPPS